MASFPELNLAPENFKIRFREEYASEVLNQRFLSEPGGVYFGFNPLVIGSTVSLLVDPTRFFSLLRVISTLSKTSLDVYFPEDLALDFTGHDFVASGDLYVIATVSYVRGGTTSSRIFTRTTPANGLDEINICRLSGTGAPGTITAFTTLFQDRTSILAVAGSTNPHGYMQAGAVEDLSTALAAIGKIPFNAAVKSAGFVMVPSDVDQIHMLDMLTIVATQTIEFPSSATLVDGCRVGFISLEGLPVAFGVEMLAAPGDAVMFQGIAVGNPVPVGSVRRDRGHFWMFTLVKTGYATPRWYRNIETLPQFHGGFHTKGEHDEIRLDDLNDPEDNTDLDATTGRHGLLRKLSNNALQFLNGVGAWAVPLIAVPNPFGDGSDGVVTIAAPTTLTRAMFYEDLTVDPGITLITDGFPIFVRGTLTNDGTIANNGADGAGGTGGVGGKGYYGIPGNVGGNAGFIQGSGNTTASTLGGDGGGVGGLAVASPILMPRSRELAVSGLYPTGFTGTPILINGGAGGGGNSTASDPAEGGGGGGGVVTVLADILINDGVIEAKGGDAENAGSFGSGGGAGGGGLVILVYGSKSGAGTTSVIAGTFGSAGTSGTVIEIPVV